MKKPSFTWLTAISLLLFAVFILSCEKNYITQAEEEHVGDYHLFFYSIYGGAAYDSTWALEYSTKTGEIIDTIKIPFRLFDLIYSADGSMSALRIYDETNNNNLMSVNSITNDTVATNLGDIAGELFLSRDEQTLMLTGYGNLAIVSFPGLDSIYIDEVKTLWGGFMTDGQKAFYMVSGVDSLFFIDFSDKENIIKTAEPLKNFGSSLFPISATVDYRNEILILMTSNSYGNIMLRIHDSNNFNQLNELNTRKKYNIASVIRPGTNEVYLANHSQLSNERNYIDVYNSDINVITSFLSSNDIISEAPFKPRHIEFTPDGNKMYIVLYANLYFSAVLGVNPNNKSVIQYFQPYASDPTLIRINPIDYSE